MSAVQTLEGMRELASSLAQDDIPVKLRCATCNKLVISAFRLPCCDQSICETCQTSLPESCPVCDHSPLSAEDCKPNKSLRLTVKAFLKAEEKKRDKDRGTPQAKHTDTSVPNTADATSTHPSQHNPAPGEDVPGKSIEEEALTNGEDISANIKNVADVREDGGSALSKGRREEPEAAASTKQVSTNEEEQSIEDSSAGGGESKRTEEANEDTTAEEQKNSWSMNAGTTQQIQGNNTAFGMSTAQGGFSNMGWNGTNGFNPMMQMGASMPSAGWNNFNMMGMPGMGMDAMAMSQGMFGGFGGQNMGMNGMNGMNMGMGFGGGFNSGWNGQMSSGDFGANAGYYPGSGYNQQSHQQSNYAHQMHHQQFPKNNYQNRFNGQGGPQTRGFGRGQTGNYGNQSNSDAQAQIADIPQGQTTTDANSKHDGNMDHQTSRSVEPSQSATVLGDSEKQHDERQDQDETQPAGDTNRVDDSTVEVGNGEPTTNDDPAPVQQDEQSAAVDVAQNVPVSEDPAGQMQVQQDQPIATYEGGADSYGMDVSVMPMAGHLDANGAYSYIQGHQGGHMPEFSTGGRGGARGYYRGGFANRGGRYMANGSYGQHNASLAVSNGDVTVLAGGTEPPGVGVVGAPTGPKAMRVGLPNTGISGRIAASSNNRSASMSGSIEPPRERDRSYTPKRTTNDEDRGRSRSPSRERQRTQSRSPARSQHHRRRNRSHSTSTESDSRKRRKHRSSRRYDEIEDQDHDRSGDSHRGQKSRPSSVDSKYKSRRDKDKHRSRRHRYRSRSRSPLDDYDARRRTNSDDATESSDRRKERSERHRRDRTRSRDRERRRRRDRSQDHEDDDRHHRSSRRSRKDRERDRDHDRDRDREDGYERERERNNSRRESRIDVQSIAIKPPTSSTVLEEPELKIQGRSRMKLAPIDTTDMPPPTGPKSRTPSTFAPPTGPAAERTKRRNSNSAPRSSATPVTPSDKSAPNTPAIDQHQEERERRNRERLLKEKQRRESLHPSIRGTADKKRSREETEEKVFAPPTGPSAQRAKKQKSSRRGEWKYDDDEEDRAGRVEREREAARWG